jgi:pSer/pThr/pTyr-binding forkhead associated (FHA) protein
MDIEIVVIGEPSKWVLNQSRIRIGQDPKCEVCLPGGKYPSVSGEHVALDVVDGAVKLVKGMRAGVETFLNGHPAGDGATIRSGDVLRLGAGGPELRIRVLEQVARSTVYEPTRVINEQSRTAYEPTRIMSEQSRTTHEPTRVISEQSRTTYEPTRVISEQSSATHEPTRVISEQSRTTHEPTRVISSPAAAAIPAASPPAAGAAARPSYTTQPARGVSSSPYTPSASAVPPRRAETVMSSGGTQAGYGQLRGQESSGQASAAQPAATRAAESENMQTLEGKLNTLRIILAANLVVLLALFTYAYLQAQELAQTHKDLQALRVQAQSAVGTLTPSLDARLNVFEKRMDLMDEKVATAQDHLVKGMDAQAKIAEDHMAQRMNAEIPAMLDKYVNQKMVELKH